MPFANPSNLSSAKMLQAKMEARQECAAIRNREDYPPKQYKEV